MNIVVHTDGGARGNPGPAAVGVVIEKEGKEIIGFGKAIGETTNNVAEYTAVIEALEKVKSQKSKAERATSEIYFYLDSMLVVNQLNGLFKVKDARLRELLARVRVLEQEVGGVIRYAYIPREENYRADFFVNQALDGLLTTG